MPRNKPSAKRTPSGGYAKEYVGPYDGSDDRWMSRGVTRSSGRLETGMVPETSRPSEANLRANPLVNMEPKDFHDREKYAKSRSRKK